jgi:hypothetical protein
VRDICIRLIEEGEIRLNILEYTLEDTGGFRSLRKQKKQMEWPQLNVEKVKIRVTCV